MKRGLLVGLSFFRLISPESHIRSSPVQHYYHAQVRHVSSNYYSKREKREKKTKRKTPSGLIGPETSKNRVSVLHYYSSNPARTTSHPDTHTNNGSPAWTILSILFCLSPTSHRLSFYTHRTHPSYPQQTQLLSQIGGSGTLPASVTASPLTTRWPLQSIFYGYFY